MRLSVNNLLIAINSVLFLYFCRGSSEFASFPMVKGGWPKIYNGGVMRFGRRCGFFGGRFRTALCAFSNGTLDVGDHAFFNEGVTICATKLIKIGHHVKVGDNVYIYDTDFHQVCPDLPLSQAPVMIGNNVWIGANAMILAGAEIGNHSVIAAGSIVTGKIPTRCVAAGNPARVVKTFEAPDNWVRS
jgi:acetyltransferase-like isoleucine patch superfamily enzyme